MEQSPSPPADRRTTSGDDEDYLAFRVFKKALGLFVFPAAVVLGVGGFFGYDLGKQVTAVRQELTEIVPAAHVQLDSLREMQRELQALVTTQAAQLTRQSQMASAQVRELTDQARDFGRALGELEASRARVEEVRALTAGWGAEMDSLTAELEAGLDSLSRGRDDIIAAESSLDETLASIERRVFGSWAFVVHEKRRTDLSPLPLSIAMSTMRNGILREFEVSSNGVVIHPASDFPLGQSRCVEDQLADSQVAWYRLTPSYIVELFLGADIAGLQVERVDSEAQCRQQTAF